MELGKAYINCSEEGVSIEYTDYGVEAFGGDDYEVHYTLNSENTEKLAKMLKCECLESLKELIIEHFGECLEKESFTGFCDKNDIRYELFTWIS